MGFFIKLLLTLCLFSLAPLDEENQKWLDQLTKDTKYRIRLNMNEPYQLLCKELCEFKARLEDEIARDKLKELKFLIEAKFDEYSKFGKEAKDLLDEFRSVGKEKLDSGVPSEPGYHSLLSCAVTDAYVDIHRFWSEKMRSYHAKNHEWVSLKKQCEDKYDNIVLTRL